MKRWNDLPLKCQFCPFWRLVDKTPSCKDCHDKLMSDIYRAKMDKE